MDVVKHRIIPVSQAVGSIARRNEQRGHIVWRYRCVDCGHRWIDYPEGGACYGRVQRVRVG